MLKLLDHDDRRYRLTIEYKGQELSYIAKLIQTYVGEEMWMIWAKQNGKKVTITLYWYPINKVLTQGIIFGQKQLPADFLEAIRQSFIEHG